MAIEIRQREVTDEEGNVSNEDYFVEVTTPPTIENEITLDWIESRITQKQNTIANLQAEISELEIKKQEFLAVNK